MFEANPASTQVVFRAVFVERTEEPDCMTKTKKPEFHPDDFIVYPAHGVGQILSIEEQKVAGIKLELFVISFEKDKRYRETVIASFSPRPVRISSTS